MVQPITDAQFSEEISQGLVLVDFWAPWCGPCRMQTPILESLEKTYQDKVKLVKMNVDENPQTAQAFGIMSIPTLILFKDGEMAEKMIGVQQKAQLEKIFNQHL